MSFHWHLTRDVSVDRWESRLSTIKFWCVPIGCWIHWQMIENRHPIRWAHLFFSCKRLFPGTAESMWSEPQMPNKTIMSIAKANSNNSCCICCDVASTDVELIASFPALSENGPLKSWHILQARGVALRNMGICGWRILYAIAYYTVVQSWKWSHAKLCVQALGYFVVEEKSEFRSHFFVFRDYRT